MGREHVHRCPPWFTLEREQDGYGGQIQKGRHQGIGVHIVVGIGDRCRQYRSCHTIQFTEADLEDDTTCRTCGPSRGREDPCEDHRNIPG